MTLAIGMVLEESVLLCADTLYSDGQTKEYRTKLFRWSGGGAHVAFALSGNASVARLVIDTCLDLLNDAARKPISKARVLNIVQGVVKEGYEQYVDCRPYEERQSHEFQLFVALSANGGSTELYVSRTTSLSRVDRYECIGSGRELARFIIESGYDPHAPELSFTLLENGCVLAIQALVATSPRLQ